ncbi:hypothetical protein K440DRAFT_558307 [Wilcoxina mikolae CBS 423.85]|nr:hypothetical protein K440DRAFT_558307 [Wilcoxina mikolae CBS 423.85]
MKASIFGLASFAFFAVTSVLASPVAIEQSPAVIERRDIVDIDVIVTNLLADVKTVNGNYNLTCASTCTQTQVTSWCHEIATLCYAAIDKCKLLPSGHKFLNLSLVAGLVFQLLLDINYTLTFLLTKCGIISLLLLVIGLVLELITALNALLTCLVIYVDGLLAAVNLLLFPIFGIARCLLVTLGLAL